MLYEYSHSTEPERRRKGYDIAEGDFVNYFLKKQKEGVKWKNEDYTDGTNTIVGMGVFETIDDFSKVWGDEEFQVIVSRWSYYVDNGKVRILRKARSGLTLE